MYLLILLCHKKRQRNSIAVFYFEWHAKFPQCLYILVKNLQPKTISVKTHSPPPSQSPCSAVDRIFFGCTKIGTHTTHIAVGNGKLKKTLTSKKKDEDHIKNNYFKEK